MYHFITSTDGAFTSHRKFLSDEAYSEALDSIVKGCSDVLILDSSQRKVLLGKRLVHPQPDWWFMGGRMMPGESPAQSVSRILKRELGLDIPPERLSYASSSSLAWDRREQAPKENGTCDVQVVMSLVLTDQEAERIVLDPKEYAGSKWELIDTITAPEADSVYHPALRFSCRCLKAREMEEKMRKVAAQPVNRESNDLLASIARDLCSLKQEPGAGIGPYQVASEALGYQGVVKVIL